MEKKFDPPTVVRIRRQNNKIIQDCDIYIGRRLTMGGWNLPQSKWANPFTVKSMGRDEALRRYEEYIRGNPQLMKELSELTGKRLGCFCKPNPCHGDILVKLFNEK
jgi:hypothetical protein